MASKSKKKKKTTPIGAYNPNTSSWFDPKDIGKPSNILSRHSYPRVTPSIGNPYGLPIKWNQTPNKISKGKKKTVKKKEVTGPSLSSLLGGTSNSGGGGGSRQLISNNLTTSVNNDLQSIIPKIDAFVEEAKKPVDISGALSAYDNLDAVYKQIAESGKLQAKNSLDTTRSDLLTSLKRFQDSHAREVADQKQAYLAGQSQLEDARLEADRQNRISAAARGISGSGLQQLAQLQNLIGQGQQISDLANKNQSVMDKLKVALAQKQEDYDSNLSKVNKSYDETLRSIADTLAGNLAKTAADKAKLQTATAESAKSREMSANELALNLKNMIANNVADNIFRAATSVTSSGGSGGSGDSGSSNDSAVIEEELGRILGNAKRDFNRTNSNKNKRKAITSAESELDRLISGFGVNSAKEVQTARRTLEDLYNSAK